VRDSSKLLTATLTTLLVTLSAAPAGARTAASSHHRHGRHAGRHGAHVRSTHGKATAKQPKAGSRAGGTPAAKPQPAKLQPAKPRETRREAAAAEKLAAAAQAASALATLLATPCQNTEAMPEGGNVPLVREAVMCLINRVRAEHSLAPLKQSAQLEAAAEDHDAEMLQVDYFAHVAPDGETPVERIRKTGYIASESDGYVIGENLAWGTYSLATPKAIVEAWVASPGHLANILESRYTETGIGIVPAVPHSLAEGNPGATYAQEFGVIVH
jgi:uncharacterized protein YkwD